MTIRHMINNEFYAQKARAFCVDMVRNYGFITEVRNTDSVISIVVYGADAETNFGKYEKYSIK